MGILQDDFNGGRELLDGSSGNHSENQTHAADELSYGNLDEGHTGSNTPTHPNE